MPEYVALFGAAYERSTPPISQATLASALAAFERTLVSDRALYDAYLAGDSGALTDTMQEGLALFEELSCDSCHEPPLFQSDHYAARLPAAVAGEDRGRYEVTGEPADRFAFRVPTLRNARDTGPYFHDGSVASLREAVALEVDNIKSEQNAPLEEALAALEMPESAGESLVAEVRSDQENLAGFLTVR